MKIAAFDAKDFNRSKVVLIPNPSNPDDAQKKFKGFFSPLGVGVIIKNGAVSCSKTSFRSWLSFGTMS